MIGAASESLRHEAAVREAGSIQPRAINVQIERQIIDQHLQKIDIVRAFQIRKVGKPVQGSVRRVCSKRVICSAVRGLLNR